MSGTITDRRADRHWQFWRKKNRDISSRGLKDRVTPSMIGSRELGDNETRSRGGVGAGNSIEFDISGVGLSVNETFRRTQAQISAVGADIGRTCYIPQNQIASAGSEP